MRSRMGNRTLTRGRLVGMFWSLGIADGHAESQVHHSMPLGTDHRGRFQTKANLGSARSPRQAFNTPGDGGGGQTTV